MRLEYRELVVGGATCRGFITHPDTESKGLVVFLHGHTGHKNETGTMFKQLSETFATNGYTTLRYDYRGSGDSDLHFSDQNFWTVYEDAYAFLMDGYALNNNKKVIVLGFSMGGAAANRLSVEYPEYIDRVVLISPATNFKEHLQYAFSHSPIVENGCIDIGGYLESEKFYESFKDIDLFEGVEKFTNKVLVVQGSEDMAVDPVASKALCEKYPNSRFLFIEGATHGYTKVPYRREINNKILEFLGEE